MKTFYFPNLDVIVLVFFTAAIFGSALSYVQEKEEPVDFLDLFLEMD